MLGCLVGVYNSVEKTSTYNHPEWYGFLYLKSINEPQAREVREAKVKKISYSLWHTEYLLE